MNLAEIKKQKQAEHDSAIFLNGYATGAIAKVYDATSPDMKTQLENAEMMCSYAKGAYPQNAELLTAVIKFSTLARIRQVALTGQMGEYDPNFVIGDIKDILKDCKTRDKVIFALTHIGQENFSTENVPQEFVDFTKHATASKDAVHKSCARYMRDEAERGVHAGRTQETADVREKEVTPSQYETAIRCHGFSDEITESLIKKMQNRQQHMDAPLCTTDLYLDIHELGLKSDKFAFMKILDENGKVVPGLDGKGFKNNGFRILPTDYMIFGSDIINVDLFSKDISKVESAINQLTSPALEHTVSNGGKVYGTEIELWKNLADDYMTPEHAHRFKQGLDDNLAKSQEHLQKLRQLELNNPKPFPG